MYNPVTRSRSLSETTASGLRCSARRTACSMRGEEKIYASSVTADTGAADDSAGIDGALVDTDAGTCTLSTAGDPAKKSTAAPSIASNKMEPTAMKR